jgi:hypothetical protein
MKLFYIAGPLKASTGAGRLLNIQKAVEAASVIRRYGGACIVPHLESLFHTEVCTEEEWLKQDFELITRCDALIYLPGWSKSAGTKKEMEFSLQKKIPVYPWESLMGCLDDCCLKDYFLQIIRGAE